MEKFQGLVDKLSRSLPDPLKGGGTVTRRRDAERMLSSSAEAILAVCPGPTGEKLQNEADRFRQKCDELVGDLFPEMLTRFEKEMVEFHAGKNCENFQAEVDIQSAVQIIRDMTLDERVQSLADIEEHLRQLEKFDAEISQVQLERKNEILKSHEQQMEALFSRHVQRIKTLQE